MRISDWSSRRVLFRSLLDAGLGGGDGVGIWVCRRLFCFRPDAGRYTLGRCRAARWTIDLRFPALAHDANAIGELVFRTFADKICVHHFPSLGLLASWARMASHNEQMHGRFSYVMV